MKTLLRHILTAFTLMVLLGGTAYAMPGHSHHNHSGPGDTLSPFEVKHGKRLHCELLGHNPLLPCPHHNKSADKKNDCLLTSDCGGGPFSTPNSRSAGDYPRFLTHLITMDGDSPSIATFETSIPLYNASHFFSLDRPPQAI